MTNANEKSELFEKLVNRPDFKENLDKLPAEDRAIFLESIRKFVVQVESSLIKPLNAALEEHRKTKSANS